MPVQPFSFYLPIQHLLNGIYTEVGSNDESHIIQSSSMKDTNTQQQLKKVFTEKQQICMNKFRMQWTKVNSSKAGFGLTHMFQFTFYIREDRYPYVNVCNVENPYSIYEMKCHSHPNLSIQELKQCVHVYGIFTTTEFYVSDLCVTDFGTTEKLISFELFRWIKSYLRIRNITSKLFHVSPIVRYPLHYQDIGIYKMCCCNNQCVDNNGNVVNLSEPLTKKHVKVGDYIVLSCTGMDNWVYLCDIYPITKLIKK